jgi:hypothetical protein
MEAYAQVIYCGHRFHLWRLRIFGLRCPVDATCRLTADGIGKSGCLQS